MRKCRQCTIEFVASRSWQLFCSNTCRDLFHRENHQICFYCGEPGRHREHIDPVKRIGKIREFNKDEWIYACRECNLTLGGKIFNSVEDRIEFLLQNYLTWLHKLETGLNYKGKKGIALRKHIEEHTAVCSIYVMRIGYMRANKMYLLENFADVDKNELKDNEIYEPVMKPKTLFACKRCGIQFEVKSEKESPFCSTFCKWIYEKG